MIKRDDYEMKAYMTVVTNIDYLKGVKVLKKSLDIVSSKYPFFVLVPDSAPAEITEELTNSNIQFIFCEKKNDFKKDNAVSYWGDTFFKLEVFKQFQFEKIVFLDSDMIVLKNIDDLFEKPHMSCVAAGQVLHKDWVDLNSGIMVIEPNKQEYEGLTLITPQIYKSFIEAGTGVGDQDVIKAYFKDWVQNKELHLNEKYNVMLGYAGYLKDDVFIYHFTGREKPWRNKIFEDLVIILKIFKRSKSLKDFKALAFYKRILKLC